MTIARSVGGVGLLSKLKLRDSERNSATSDRQTGQRSRCSSIATLVGKDTQSSMYNESDCLVSSHNIGKLLSPSIFEDASKSWIADRPRLLPFLKKKQLRRLRQTFQAHASDAPTGVAGHVFNTALISLWKPSARRSSLRPIWHRVQ